MLVIEGLLPLFVPARWKDTFRRMIELRDGQVRFFGLLSIGIGLALLAVLLLFHDGS
jgi:uncharacterized protein YjeT (DUF2065 family)